MTTVGANIATFLDTGLTANTLYYYRVIATTAGPDAPASNRATASTFPATAAKVCFDRVPRPNAFAIPSGAAWDGTAWGVAWTERDAAEDNTDVVFRRFDATTLQPLGPAVQVGAADSNGAGFPPRLAWNGTHYALTWFENVRGDKSTAQGFVMMFALLDQDGAVVRGTVRIPVPLPNFDPITLVWDGSHWGVFGTSSPDDGTTTLFGELFFMQLAENGSTLIEPVALSDTPELEEFPVDAAWSTQKSQYGVAFVRGRDLDQELLFQRFDASGVAIDEEPLLLTGVSTAGGLGGGGNAHVVWDGSNWAVAWTHDDPFNQDTAVYLWRVDGNTGLAIGVEETRISDDGDAAENLAEMLPKPGGGFALFVDNFDTNVGEIARLQATAGGARDGSLAYMSPVDSQQSTRGAYAGNGTNFLVVYGVGGTSTQPNELYGVLVAANGLSPPAAPVTLTSGHDPGADLTRQLYSLAVGDGFVGVWVDGVSNAQRINLRAWNGSGQAVSTLTPLTATSTRGVVGHVAVGNTFALAWKTLSNDIVFARYNATGGTLVSEKVIANAGTNQNANITLGWDGENYAIWWNNQGGSRFQRVQPDGTAIGSPTSVPRGLDGTAQMAWLGDGWALVTRSGQFSNVDYLRLSASGVVLAGPTTLTANVNPVRFPANMRLRYTGTDFGLAFTQWAGFDPPYEDLYFTVLDHDGNKAFPEVPVLSTGLPDGGARLYSVGTDFRVVAASYGFFGVSEVGVTPAGAVQPGVRRLSNRGASSGGPAIAYNGATLGMLWTPSGLPHLYFQTDACLADATPPPCPVVTPGFADGAAQLSWNAVTDPETGVVRYVVYRDGGILAELDADLLAYADPGYEPLGPNSYQVRALNGAFVESQSCPATVPDVNKIFDDSFEQP